MTAATVSPLVASKRCADCAEGIAAPFPFSMAFQPVVNLAEAKIYAYEALVRGPAGEPAPTILSQVTPANRYSFDQSCRVKAIEVASRLGLKDLDASLSINFIPGAMYQPENCVRATLAASRRHGLPLNRLIFELTENEEILDHDHLENIFRVYRANGFRLAIDDFGSGYSGLTLLAQFAPDVVKIDMALVRCIHTKSRQHAIVAGLVSMCHALSAEVVAEGVETRAELDALRDIGVTLFQGYLFAKPGFEILPEVRF